MWVRFRIHTLERAVTRAIWRIKGSFGSSWKWKSDQWLLPFSKVKCISNRAQELRRRIDKLDAIFCDNFSSPYIAGVLREYDGLKTELKSIYEEKGKQTMFRAKCRWIENGERPTKFFFNLEKVITTKKLLANVNFTRWFYYAQRDSDSRAKLKTIIETYIPRI